MDKFFTNAFTSESVIPVLKFAVCANTVDATNNIAKIVNSFFILFPLCFVLKL